MPKRKLLDHIRLTLQEHNHRLTPQREAVVNILITNSDTHLSAESIFFHTKDVYPEIGLATVYRTLELLESHGLVHKFDYGDGQALYEINLSEDGHYHHHLICVKCGNIGEFNDDLLEDIEHRIEKETGFQVTDHCLRFFGVCTKCRTSS